MKNMIKTLNDNGYELLGKTNDYSIFDNKELEQLVVLMPVFEHIEEENYIDEIINEIQKIRYNKKTMAFIGKIKDNEKEDVLNCESWFMRVEGFDSNLIPRKVDKIVELRAVEYHLENGLFYNPYKNTTVNITNILKEINMGVTKKIIYNYPKPMIDAMMYMKYFLNKKVTIK